MIMWSLLRPIIKITNYTEHPLVSSGCHTEVLLYNGDDIPNICTSKSEQATSNTIILKSKNCK